MAYGELQIYKVVSKNGEIFFFSVRASSEAARNSIQGYARATER
jgi:hypothetical protein